MAEVKKVPDEDLVQLRSIQERFEWLIRRKGELHFQRDVIDDELAVLTAEFRKLEQGQAEMVTKLQEHFGSTGAVTLSTGEFVPDLQ